MNASFLRFARLLAGSVLLLSSGVHAEPRSVDAFDAQTWAALQKSLKAPAVVVFTTTDCIYCPAVIQQLASDIRERQLDASVVAVVIDAAPGQADASLLLEPHYRAADRLFAFSGQTAALRYSVNPSWRGVTPYVAFLRPGEPPTWVTGPPSAQAVAAWAQESKSPRRLR